MQINISYVLLSPTCRWISSFGPSWTVITLGLQEIHYLSEVRALRLKLFLLPQSQGGMSRPGLYARTLFQCLQNWTSSFSDSTLAASIYWATSCIVAVFVVSGQKADCSSTAESSACTLDDLDTAGMAYCCGSARSIKSSFRDLNIIYVLSAGGDIW